jgi:hypothetical protein
LKIPEPIILLVLTFSALMGNAQTGGCGDARAQVCNPGQYADISGDQVACRPCTGNSFANGCTLSCSQCASGMIPTSDHSSCVVKGGCGDARAQICSPGQYADISGDQVACRACTGNSFANGCTLSCSQCASGMIPTADHSGCEKSAEGIDWSPHSKPFDLVWDLHNEDYNGLPLNPLWAYQLTTTDSLPDFENLCGPAFSGGNTINYTTLAADCTSQPTTLDVDTSSLVGDSFLGSAGYCSGLINGHLTWMIATFTGWIGWEGFSGDANFLDNLDLADGDYNLLLDSLDPDQKIGPNVPPSPAKDYPAFTALNYSENGLYGIGLEFNDDETINNAGGPWWQQLVSIASDTPQYGWEMFYPYELPGVVTGVIGIDGVHGGYTESHPVFALALDTQETVVRQSSQNWALQQNWVFFLHNYGNGGGCSEKYYTWPGQPGNQYYIQLPWPKGAIGVSAGGPGQFWDWQPEPAQVSGMLSPNPGWTLIKVQFPGGGHFGVDGTLTLVYNFPPSYQPTTFETLEVGTPGLGRGGGGGNPGRKRAVPKGRGEEEDHFDLAVIAQRIADPALKAKFTAEARTALKPSSRRPRARVAPRTFATTLEAAPRTSGPASRGEITRPQALDDPAKKEFNDALKKLIDTYRPHMQPAPPAKK